MTAKRKELLKALALSLFAVCIFGAGFIVLNNTVFALTADLPSGTVAGTSDNGSALPGSTEILIENSLRIPNERAAVGDFVVPNLNVIEAVAIIGACEITGARSGEIDDAMRSPGALSAEKAAIIGAEYIWDMFGISIDGKDVRMQYVQASDRIRPYWVGAVVLPEVIHCTDGYVGALMGVPDCPNHATTFLLDVVTGERIGIERPVEHHGIFMPSNISEEYLRQQEINPAISVRDVIDLPIPLRFEEVAEETGRIFAQRHFGNPDVRVTQVFESEFVRGLNKNPAGDIVITPRHIFITAKDSNDREVRFQIIIHDFEAVLIEVETQHNDLIYQLEL